MKAQAAWPPQKHAKKKKSPDKSQRLTCPHVSARGERKKRKKKILPEKAKVEPKNFQRAAHFYPVMSWPTCVTELRCAERVKTKRGGGEGQSIRLHDS